MGRPFELEEAGRSYDKNSLEKSEPGEIRARPQNTQPVEVAHLGLGLGLAYIFFSLESVAGLGEKSSSSEELHTWL